MSIQLSRARAESLIHDLGPQDFQSLCQRLIMDLGYVTQRGPIKGPDGSQDGVAHYPRHYILSEGHGLANQPMSIVFHCSSSIKPPSFLKRKFISDALGSARKDVSSPTVPDAMYFFSKKPLASSPRDLDLWWADRVRPQLKKLDVRYEDKQTGAVCFDAAGIADWIIHSGPLSYAYRLLRNRLYEVSHIDAHAEMWHSLDDKFGDLKP